uniref:DUF7745 domain-containing protein n=1 Tax=Gossypium raimondii TaxID=29730 RepID=A0A0D2Q9H5_GOSRA|nr:hypothetical protein B456_002G202700 [Gossypium raimondii]
MSITGMSEQWVAARIKQKGDSKYIPWRSLKDAILTHLDVRKRLDVFALSIYGLVVFPKALGYVDEAVTNLFDRLDKKVTLIPVIFTETFRSLSACRRTGDGRFIECAQLLLAWFYSHFWKVDKVSYRVFFENYSPLKEIVATPRRDDISEEKWMVILQNLQEEDVEWRAPWLLPDEILYMCGNFNWVPLLGVCGAIGYAPLLVLRQYRSRQFIPATQGIANCEFSYKDDGYKKKIQKMSSAWKQTRRMRGLAVGPMITPKYNELWGKRINDNIPKIEETKQRKKQRAKRAEKEGKKERKKEKEKEKGKFKVLRFQAQLLMSCTSHCPRKERRKWTRSDSREIPVSKKNQCSIQHPK